MSKMIMMLMQQEETNLATNVNDKDGKPDNVDNNYMPHAWNSTSR